jgi:hypothetical protein
VKLFSLFCFCLLAFLLAFPLALLAFFFLFSSLLLPPFPSCSLTGQAVPHAGDQFG